MDHTLPITPRNIDEPHVSPRTDTNRLFFDNHLTLRARKLVTFEEIKAVTLLCEVLKALLPSNDVYDLFTDEKLPFLIAEKVARHFQQHSDLIWIFGIFLHGDVYDDTPSPDSIEAVPSVLFTKPEKRAHLVGQITVYPHRNLLYIGSVMVNTQWVTNLSFDVLKYRSIEAVRRCLLFAKEYRSLQLQLPSDLIYLTKLEHKLEHNISDEEELAQITAIKAFVEGRSPKSPRTPRTPRDRQQNIATAVILTPSSSTSSTLSTSSTPIIDHPSPIRTEETSKATSSSDGLLDSLPNMSDYPKVDSQNSNTDELVTPRYPPPEYTPPTPRPEYTSPSPLIPQSVYTTPKTVVPRLPGLGITSEESVIRADRPTLVRNWNLIHIARNSTVE